MAALSGLAWLPLALVLGAVSAVAYADHLVVSISLVYLYILPLAVGAIVLRTKASYGLIVSCVLFHDCVLPARYQSGRFESVTICPQFYASALGVYGIQRDMQQRRRLQKPFSSSVMTS